METLSTATLENHKAIKYIFCGLTSIAHTVFLQIKTLFISLHNTKIIFTQEHLNWGGYNPITWSTL